MKIRLKDNTTHKIEKPDPADQERYRIVEENDKTLDIAKDDLENLKALSTLNINNDSNVLIFKVGEDHSEDETKKPLNIFSVEDEKIKTGNMMGFIGKNGTEVTISSRFTTNRRDHFLHHMLSKVLSCRVVGLPVSAKDQNDYEFCPYFFPPLLNKAVAQGLYKQYQRRKYNDSNIKGAIDLPRHLRLNPIFCGKIAYSVREYAHDNNLTQLIRHTIEFLDSRPEFKQLLTQAPETIANVLLIRNYTPSYKKGELHKIIKANLKPINHPYFMQYKPLQKLCLQILRHEEISYAGQEDEVYGLLFDGARLWEKYLSKVLRSEGIKTEHPCSEDLFFNNENKEMRPDFLFENGENKIPADAKYKFISRKEKRSDYFQIISYMCRFDSNIGFLLCPLTLEENDNKELIENIIDNNKQDTGNKDIIFEVGLRIPACDERKMFDSEIKTAEKDFVKKIKDELDKLKESKT